jgi:4'-phosphopantetheinyl transferase
MRSLPPAVFCTQWRDNEIAVFATAGPSAVSLEDAVAIFSPEENARAARFHFEEDRERWTRSRALLRLWLALRLEVSPESLVFETGSHGKLSLRAHPRCHFNLSHSGSLVALAAGPEPVGIDIEHCRDLPFASLATHAFRPEEIAAIQSSVDPGGLFYQLWTAKEAVMKCTGQGMSLPPADIDISMKDSVPSSASCSGGRRYALLSLTLPGGYSLAAAVFAGP